MNFLQAGLSKLALRIISVIAQYRYRKGFSEDRITLEPEDLLSSITYFVDSSGKTMFGTNRYILRFEPGQSVPPANTLWSLTLFEFLPSGGLGGISPVHHGEIDSSMLPTLQRDAEGGLTIYIQRDLPSQILESNWLCTQNGQFMVVLRLLWNGSPTTPVTWKVPRVLQMN